MFALTLTRLRRTFFSMSARVLELLTAAAAILGLGLASSWYLVEAGTSLTTERVGPWVTWTSAAKPDADPYTRAHFSYAGTLSVSTDVQKTYIATVDQAGERLQSSCEYQLEGRLVRADWWSIVVFNQQGLLISNPAGRHAFTSQSIAMQPNGGFSIALAREARPGNWLPTRGAGRIAVVLTVVEARSGEPTLVVSDESGRNDGASLPTLRKVKCR